MSEAKIGLLRKLPSINDLLTDEQLLPSQAQIPHRLLAEAAREAVEHMRENLLSAGKSEIDEGEMVETIREDIRGRVAAGMRTHYCRVVNATGIILHTALGRAVLSAKALEQIRQELSGYSLLQMDPQTGKRSARDGRIEWLLQKLTGAPAATVVNNNAAATAIVLNTIAAGKEVIVSRGHLVEIGGSFRLPEVMAASGAKLVEVGTTNKTHRRDYENAITEETAAILRVHPSNYKISGFTSEVSLGEMIEVAHENGLVLIDDVGAGALIDFSKFGFDYEPMLGDSLGAGSDIVTSSGDKLIGGAQSGIILGKKEYIQAVRKNPWARILRVDKLTLAVQEATLKAFLDEKVALKEIPTLAMLRRKMSDITEQAGRIADELSGLDKLAEIKVIDGSSQMGSGSLPTQNLATKVVAIKPRQMSVEELAQKLRWWRVPIISRINEGEVLLDCRTLRGDDEQLIIEALINMVQLQ